MAKRYINVAYKDRDMAKRLGARWDPSVKRWYCPPDSALATVYGWRKASGSPPSGVMSNIALDADRRGRSPIEGQRQLSLLG